MIFGKDRDFRTAYLGFWAAKQTIITQADSIRISRMSAYLNASIGCRKMAMAGVILPNVYRHRLSFAAAIFFLWTVSLQAVAEDDLFQEAINYVFTGRIDPKDGPDIVDRKSCIVVVPEPDLNRYARYYLKRFKMDAARISKKYAGRQTIYELEVEGDDVILEFLKADKTTVDYGFKSAHISLPGNIDQTEKALQLVFAEHCKPDKPRSPF
jgi:hypothetical protein